MAISLKSEHLRRYSQLARLLVKYGRSDLVRNAGLEETLDEGAEPAVPIASPEAHELATDLEAMGPTFIKLGQLLSTRLDLIPVVYAEALSRLQDDVEPFPAADVERIMQQELGVRLSRAFVDFDPIPIAAASLGQVHRATLRDGRPVAVKVQRPGIRAVIVNDLEALAEIADLLENHTDVGDRYQFAQLLAEMRRTLLRELDYRQEATNLSTLGANLAGFERIIVPEPIEDYTTSRVLTMDYVKGTKITSVGPLARLEIQGQELAETLFEAYLKQILVDGFFHADPHPGNVFLTDDRRIALIDVGMVGRLTPDLQDRLVRLLLAISEVRGEEAADLLVELGERRPDFDAEAFRREITRLVVQHHNVSAAKLQIGRVVVELTRAAAENGLRVPAQLTLLGKTLLNLDQVGRTLDPTFEPNAAIRRHTVELMQQRMLKNVSPGQVFSSLLEMNEFAQRLPGRLGRVLDVVADNEIEVKVSLTNANMIMEGLQKIANRVALGAVLAALIIGAAMLMRVETTFRLLGYPGYAMLLFLGAAVGGVMLMFDIVLHDRRGRRGNRG